MNKFKVLKYHDFAVTKLKVHPFVIYYILLNLVAFVVSSTVFVYQNASQFDVALRACLFIFGVSQTTGMFYSYETNLSKIQTVHSKLNKLIDKVIEGKICGRNGDQNALNIYRGWENNGRKMSTAFFYYGCFQVFSIVSALIRPIFDICMGNTDTSKWHLSFSLFVPFDTESVLGWFLDWCFQLSSGITYSLAIVLTSTHFICFCYYIFAICDHFDLVIESLRFDCTQQNEDYKQNYQHAIEIHVQIYEIFKMIADAESGVLFSLLPITALFVSTSMFTIEHAEFHPIVFGMDILAIVCSLMWLSVFCHFATLAADRVSSLGDSVYDLNWIDHPVEMQKYAILMISRSHERIYFSGFGIISCSLETFGKLLNSASKYYVVFRRLSQH